MDKISVIVPVWNAENFLKRCVDSIISQTYQNLEIILVDDGSADSSWKICQEYAVKDKRIKSFHKENEGQASARNYALDRITGDFVGFVDDDDWIYPDMYEKLYQYIVEYDADIARCSDCLDEREEAVKNIQVSVTEHDKYFGLVFQDIWGGHVTDRLFRYSLIENYRFPDSKTIEDMRFMRIILPYVRREVFTNEKLYFYTTRQDSTSFVYARNFINSYERAVEYQERYDEAVKKYPEYAELLLQKATTFSCGTYKILLKSRKDRKNLLELKAFLKKNKRKIMRAKNIGIKYKMFVYMLR